MLVVATSVTASPPRIVIESTAWGVVPPQLAHVDVALKLPPPVPLEVQLFAARTAGVPAYKNAPIKTAPRTAPKIDFFITTPLPYSERKREMVFLFMINGIFSYQAGEMREIHFGS
jgi:hypothetical protein